jgi:formyltetrahydrofolate deformylase
MTARNRAVVSVIGRDQKGVVARISTYLASCDINIEDIEQKVMEGLFIMTMLVDLSELSCTLDELVDGLKRIGAEISMEVKLRLASAPTERKRVAVLVTREPHCLEQLVRDRDGGLLNGDLAVVLSNHPDLEPIARAAGIPFAWSASADKAAHEGFLLAKLAEVKPDLVVLARYMQILTPKVIDRYPFRIINIHPSLLPAFPGLRVQQRAIDAGSRISGCTVHFVTPDLDAGPIIAQAAVPVLSDDTADTLAARILRQEHRLYPTVVRWFAEGRLSVAGSRVAVAGLPQDATLLFSPEP